MIEDQLYREELLEIYQNPKNRGKITKPDLEAKLDNPICGDEVTIQARVSNGGVIKKAFFSGEGCAISQAGASLLALHIEGKTLSSIRNLNSSDMLKLLGISPSPARMGCALLSLEVLKEAISNGLQS